MPNCGSRSVSVPIEEVAVVDRCRRHLVQQLDDVRLALCALNSDAPDEARSAFLNVIDGQLKRIGEEAEADLSGLPNWLQCQT